MDRNAVREHTTSVRLAGYASNPARWRLPAAELTDAEREEALRRWPTTRDAVQALYDGLADTRLSQEFALIMGLHRECFIMAEALARVIGFRSVYWQARQCFELGLTAARAEGEKDWEAVICTRMGVLWAAEGSPDEAAAWYRSAYDLHEATRHRLGLASVCECWARAEAERRDYHRAEELAWRARDLFEAEGRERGVAITDRRLALLSFYLGRVDEALSRYKHLITRFDDLGDEVMAAKVRAEYAQALIADRRCETALEQITIAGQEFVTCGADRDVIRMDVLRAAAYAKLGDREQAHNLLLTAYRAYTRTGDQSRANRLAEQLAR